MKTVTVIYHQEKEGWWAESTDAPSFFATGPSRDVVRQRVRESLPRVVSDELRYVDVEIAAPAGVVETADFNETHRLSDRDWTLPPDTGTATA
jgi:predicted RNase H-like HicB family nuclease